LDKKRQGKKQETCWGGEGKGAGKRPKKVTSGKVLRYGMGEGGRDYIYEIKRAGKRGAQGKNVGKELAKPV